MAHTENMFETYAASSKSAFDYWISFFPTAPMFGVEWRFGELISSDTAKPVKSPEAKAQVVKKPVKAAEKPVETAVPTAPAPKAAAPKAIAPKLVTPKTTAPEAAAPKAVVSEAVAPEEKVASVPKEPAKPKATAKPKAPAKAKPLTKPVLLAEKPEVVDPLTEIKGVGPGLEKQLHALGIYTFAQLMDLNELQLEWLDENLTTVKGRCIRDDWSGQAKALSA